MSSAHSNKKSTGDGWSPGVNLLTETKTRRMIMPSSSMGQLIKFNPNEEKGSIPVSRNSVMPPASRASR